MNLLIEQLIVDYHERTLPQFSRRNINFPCIKGKIDTVILKCYQHGCGV